MTFYLQKHHNPSLEKQKKVQGSCDTLVNLFPLDQNGIVFRHFQGYFKIFGTPKKIPRHTIVCRGAPVEKHCPRVSRIICLHANIL